MDWEMERILRISVWKLMDSRLGPSLRRKLLISNVLESVLCSVDSSYYVGKPENETDVEMDEGKNELKKNRPNQNRNEGTKAAKETGEDKKHLKVSKRRRLEVVGENKRFKKETVFSYGDVKLTVTDEYVQEPI